MSLITAIPTVYRRPHTLAPLVAALRGQSVPPKFIWAWANDPGEELSTRLRSSGLDRVITCSDNAFFHGRFALALLAPTEFVAIVDDDSIPGRDWFANCLDTMARTPGILGTAGIVLHDLDPCSGIRKNSDVPGAYAGASYVHRTMHGWQRPCDEAVEVDLVGQAWFLRTEWVRYLFAERPVTGTNGEDIELAARAWRLAGIRSYCPPHPAGDQRLWGSTRGMELGLDQVASSVTRADHLAQRERIVRAEIAAGWRPLFARRAASVGNAVPGVPRVNVAGQVPVPSRQASGGRVPPVLSVPPVNVAGQVPVPSSHLASATSTP